VIFGEEARFEVFGRFWQIKVEVAFQLPRIDQSEACSTNPRKFYGAQAPRVLPCQATPPVPSIISSRRCPVTRACFAPLSRPGAKPPADPDPIRASLPLIVRGHCWVGASACQHNCGLHIIASGWGLFFLVVTGKRDGACRGGAGKGRPERRARTPGALLCTVGDARVFSRGRRMDTRCMHRSATRGEGCVGGRPSDLATVLLLCPTPRLLPKKRKPQQNSFVQFIHPRPLSAARAYSHATPLKALASHWQFS
jgi:hypothetical protein